MKFEIAPIAWVRSGRREVRDDDWGGTQAVIELDDSLEPDAIDGIEDFSHVEVIFVFDRVDEARIVAGARHPRNNTEWPAVGIFAQRGKNRPNRLGSTIARVVSREGRVLVVAELDAVEGTPIVDLKPVMREFLPRENVIQPAWSRALMDRYWNRSESD